MHEIEFVHVDTLRPNPRNAHTHSKKQTHQIADSIVACGFATPVLIDENSMLLAGHGRLRPRSLGLVSNPSHQAGGPKRSARSEH